MRKARSSQRGYPRKERPHTVSAINILQESVTKDDGTKEGTTNNRSHEEGTITITPQGKQQYYDSGKYASLSLSLRGRRDYATTIKEDTTGNQEVTISKETATTGALLRQARPSFLIRKSRSG